MAFDASAGVVPHGSVSVRMMTDVGRAHGVDESILLAGSGIAAADLGAEHTRIWPDQEFTVARNLLAAVGDRPGLGIETARQATLGKAGIVGLAALVSATVGDVLALAIRYQALVAVAVRYVLREQGDRVLLEVDGDAIPADVRDYFLEREVALIFIAAQRLGIRIPVLRLESQLPAGQGAALTELMSAPPDRVAFGCARTRLILPRDYLEHPMPQADSHTAALIERQCREALQRLVAGGWRLSNRVRERLLRDPGIVPTMAEVAAELHITSRTLRRQLAAEGATFRGLLNTVRETRAAELLRTGASVEDVARLLGYAETANFTHAFTRWRGMSPRAYRQSLTGNAQAPD
ncbi:AraC family transcriptional regulator [Nocardia sp. CDC159]|uniref:AraC family transcriptional regulator n=1 Tax=Nocardia pulmonis TaxID=2951408 RepID=A0A9X2EB95_9NOCA|nr:MULTISPECIES: AraC family transcriptional regulator [Nocardia]MCM6775186.1 AraC family transcriptional regulator [Nocardia pulmonis]MCM6789656.1 AraC family transcriptional regulator [Nocardia sp. CDC159]